jgi:hypothetical protein
MYEMRPTFRRMSAGLIEAETKMAVFWVVAPCSLVEGYRRFKNACCLLIALMLEAARTSETLVNFYQTTRRCNPEDSHLRTHHRENLKSYEAETVSETTCNSSGFLTWPFIRGDFTSFSRREGFKCYTIHSLFILFSRVS